MGEDVELCLEVQVDPASKRILSNPEKCRSTLLDVTVVKPKEIDAFGTHRTNTLRADEVRRLITSMERERRKKQKILDKFKYEDTIIKVRKHEDPYDSHYRSRRPFTKHKERIISSNSPVDDLERKDFIGIAESVEPLFCEIRRSLKNVETRITNMQDINLVISQTTVGRAASAEYLFSKQSNRSPLGSSNGFRNQSVYRVETAPHDLKSVLLCQNKQKLLERGDKIEGKCLCENCGIVGLLMECQKHPLLNELSESPPPSDHRELLNSKKKTRFNVGNVDSLKAKKCDDASYINHLTNRVKMLEHRLSMQEERVVPKDYFKKIIGKMVTNLSPKMFKSKSDVSMHYQEKNAKKDTKHESCCLSPCSGKAHHCKSAETFNCFNTNVHLRNAKHKTNIKNDKSTITEDDIYNGGYIWRWGEEILKPGIDLKNRIVTLLHDILSKFALTERGSTETTRIPESIRGENYNSETFKKFMKHMQSNVFNAQVDTKTKFITNDYSSREANNGEPFRRVNLLEFSKKNHERGASPDKLKAHQSRKADIDRYQKNIDVSYVNPKLSLWRKESPDVHKTDLSEHKSKNLGRQEFLKIVRKAKQHQKDVLWKNIWSQAKANGQGKEDKITIKIPSQNKGGKGNQMFETEITIKEVEEILKGV